MKRNAIILLMSGLVLLAGCSTSNSDPVQEAAKLTNEMQVNVDHANALINQQSQIDKVVTSPDPNTREKAEIQKALADLNQASQKQVPAYTTAVKNVQKGMQSFQNKVKQLDNGDVKKLSQTSMNSFQTMTNSELSYANEAQNYLNIQIQFFNILNTGKEPTDAQINQINGEMDKYSKSIDQLNADIDAFNKDWGKLANKAGAKVN